MYWNIRFFSNYFLSIRFLAKYMYLKQIFLDKAPYKINKLINIRKNSRNFTLDNRYDILKNRLKKSRMPFLKDPLVCLSSRPLLDPSSDFHHLQPFPTSRISSVTKLRASWKVSNRHPLLRRHRWRTLLLSGPIPCYSGNSSTRSVSKTNETDSYMEFEFPFIVPRRNEDPTIGTEERKILSRQPIIRDSRSNAL